MAVKITGNFNLVGQIKGSDVVSPVPMELTSTLQWTLNNPTPGTNDFFGYSVSSSGNYAIVGAYWDGTGASGSGSAYIYDVTTGALLHTLNNPTPAVDDGFGWSVAIDGNHAIVGAYYDDTGALNSGSAYIYDVTTGALVHTLNNPTPGSYEQFGYSVSISGNYAIVGSHGDDTGAGDAGSAYIYNVTTGALVHTLNNPAPGTSDYFGLSVSISGNYAIVAAPYDDAGATDSGSAYIYDVTTGSLVHTLNNPTPAATDRFGLSVSISGNLAIVGAYLDDTGATDSGSAYIYDVTTGALLHTLNNPTPASGDEFGRSVSISGNYAIVSGHLDDTGAGPVGSAYIYDVTTGNLLWTLNNPTPAAGDQFGYSVSISGNNVIVGAFQDSTGAPNAGSAYIYTISEQPVQPVQPVTPPTGTLLWTLNNPTPAINDYFGRAVAVDGNYAIVGAWRDDTGATDAGSAYIYNVTTGALVHALNNPAPADSDRFGLSVSISGNYAIVGAHNDDTGADNAGSAYIYDVTTGALLRTINNPSPAINDNFGYAVAIDGNYAIVGAWSDDTGASNAGSAYIYDVTTGALLRTLNNPTPALSDYFGYSVSISGNYAIVGAYWDDTGGTDTGSAYIYDITTGSLLWTLNNPTPASFDYFGISVSISGNYAIVGAYADDTSASNAGSAYIYDVTTGALLRTINNPTPAINDYFGSSVSISGNYAIVGAYWDDTGAINAGSAYIYDVSTGELLRTINNPTPAIDEYFGVSVSISGSTVIVGAYGIDTGADNAGSAYIYN